MFTPAASKPAFSFGSGSTPTAAPFGANVGASSAGGTNPTSSFNFGMGINTNGTAPAAPQPPTGTGFGGFGATTGTAGFGSTTGTTSFGAAAQQPSSAGATSLVSSFSTHPFQYIQQCYDPNSLNYRFRAYFYNPVEGGVIKYAISKPAFISDRLWTQIRNDNPDPERMVPIVANGFDDMKTRAAWQKEQVTAQKAKIEELENQTAALMKKTDLDVTTQLQQVQKQQIILVKRIISIMKTYESVRKAGQKLTPNEAALKQKIDELMAKLAQSPSFDQNTVRTLQYQIQALQETDQLDALKSVKGLQLDESEASMAIVSVLLEQQKGIKAIASTVQKDLKDLETMRFGFQM